MLQVCNKRKAGYWFEKRDNPIKSKMYGHIILKTTTGYNIARKIVAFIFVILKQ